MKSTIDTYSKYIKKLDKTILMNKNDKYCIMNEKLEIGLYFYDYKLNKMETLFDILNKGDNIILNNDEDTFIETNMEIKLKILYRLIGNNYEINTKNFVFFKLKNIIKRFYSYLTFFDIGLTYVGMGRIILLSYCPIKKFYFFRMDGGSNHYEREQNKFYYSNIIIPPHVKQFLDLEELLDIFVKEKYLVDYLFDNKLVYTRS